MKTIKYMINYGGYIGAETEYEIDVDDNATEDEIASEIQDAFEEIIKDECSWEILEDEEDE